MASVPDTPRGRRMPGRRYRIIAVAVGALAILGATSAAQDPATLLVPTTTRAGWELLTYRGIPEHEVTFGPGGMTIVVRASAAPLVYPLAMPTAVRALEVRGRIDGSLTLPAGTPQGADGADDYVLRAGVVLTGSRRPGFLARLFAPPWLDRLFALAPDDSGLSEVRFFNVAADPAHVGDRRRHPLNDLLAEEVVAVPGPDGAFTFTAPLETSERALALWLSADGDDTGSTFTVQLERLALLPALELIGSGDP